MNTSIYFLPILLTLGRGLNGWDRMYKEAIFMSAVAVVIFQSSSGFYGRDAHQTTGQLVIRLFLRKVYYIEIPWDSISPKCVAFFLFHFGITQRGWHLENLVTSTVVIDWFKMLSAAARPNCLQPETHSCSRSLPKRYVFHIIIIVRATIYICMP